MAVDEAKYETTEFGKAPATAGWFALHVSEVPWIRTEKYGSGCRFEGKERFSQVGVNLRVLQPGQPASLYHKEEAQEDFFVVSGECVLVVEEQERRLRAGHFVHCPPGTAHVFVGAGDGPCVILMMGYRPEQPRITYPVSPVAAAHDASVTAETNDPRVAYGDRGFEPTKGSWPLYGVE
ncbi:MAG: cupin domain-containing protein [Acidobacteriota bacterium]|jgi:uncharacterized cupin superfamily protein